MHLLEVERQKVNSHINHWNLIVIISTSIQNISFKFCTYSFVAINLCPSNNFVFF